MWLVLKGRPRIGAEQVNALPSAK